MARAYLQCIEEGCYREQEQDSDLKDQRCAFCGGPLQVSYQFDLCDPEELRQRWIQRLQSNQPLDRSGVWRFRELIPFVDSEARVISLSEGSTPLVNTPRAGRWAGGVRFRVKHQGANPTGSFKDLGMTTCISRAVALGVRVVACASTGNTSSSMAAYAARAGMRALIFVPRKKISTAKLAQALDFGALAIEIGDSFDEAFRLLREIAPEWGLYLANSINPFRIEGQKTVVPEMLEQSAWRSPDYIAVPGGNLGNASAVGKGLRELEGLGLIQKMPHLVVVQASGANPFFRMLEEGSPQLNPIERPHTEATAIRIGAPASWKKARGVLDWTEGLCESVTDEEIFQAKTVLAEDGVGCEPASAAAVAGVRKLCQAGRIESGAEVIAILTGNQLKDTDYILRHQQAADADRQRIHVEPSLKALREALGRILSPEVNHSRAG